MRKYLSLLLLLIFANVGGALLVHPAMAQSGLDDNSARGYQHERELITTALLETKGPRRFIILIDRSGSMYTEPRDPDYRTGRGVENYCFSIACTQVASFFSSAIKDEDYVTLFFFANRPEPPKPKYLNKRKKEIFPNMTYDMIGAQLKEDLNVLKSDDTGTNIRWAHHEALKIAETPLPDGQRLPTYILLVSDGYDDEPTTDREARDIFREYRQENTTKFQEWKRLCEKYPKRTFLLGLEKNKVDKNKLDVPNRDTDFQPVSSGLAELPSEVKGKITGEVQTPAPAEKITIKLLDQKTRKETDVCEVNADKTFSCGKITPGEYLMEVSAGRFEKYQSLTSAYGGRENNVGTITVNTPPSFIRQFVLFFAQNLWAVFLLLVLLIGGAALLIAWVQKMRKGQSPGSQKPTRIRIRPGSGR